jgi:serine phosphatase RsbU (regulator of sigma subunit)
MQMPPIHLSWQGFRRTFPDSQYQELDLQLESGDINRVLLGRTRRSGMRTSEDFGLKRLAEVVLQSREERRRVVDAVNAHVEDFVGRTPFHDDRTLIVVKML